MEHKLVGSNPHQGVWLSTPIATMCLCINNLNNAFSKNQNFRKIKKFGWLTLPGNGLLWSKQYDILLMSEKSNFKLIESVEPNTCGGLLSHCGRVCAVRRNQMQ
jgi:hypothetical protein